MSQILKGVKCERCNGVFHNSDFYFVVDDKTFCERCASKTGGLERSRSYLVYEGQDIRILDKKTIGYPGDALLAVRKGYANAISREIMAYL